MGLVHRDIKPGNVMLTKRGVVKVMDFGIARALQSGVTSMTQTGMVVGTPQYLSPEQALGRGVDARSDLYSVGCMLFELLTGRLPFDGDSPLAVAYQHVQEEPPVPSVDQPGAAAGRRRAGRPGAAQEPGGPLPDRRRDARRSARGSASGGAPLGPATPLVIGEGPKAHHGGYPATGHPDSFAVFPNATGDPHTPPPYAAQTPPPQMNFGPPTPPPNPGPQQYAPVGYQTPPPVPRPPMQSYHTQPPVPRRGGGNWKPLIIVGSIAVVIAVILLGVIGSLSNKNKSDASGPNGTTQSDSAQSGGTGTQSDSGGGVKQGDPSRTIDPTMCTQATDGFTQDSGGKVGMPDLTFKYIDSVKSCMQQAGWHLENQVRGRERLGQGHRHEPEPGALQRVRPEEGHHHPDRLHREEQRLTGRRPSEQGPPRGWRGGPLSSIGRAGRSEVRTRAGGARVAEVLGFVVAAHARRQGAPHLLQLGAGRHLLGEQRGLDAVEESLQPAHQLGLRDAQFGLAGHGAVGERAARAGPVPRRARGPGPPPAPSPSCGGSP